MKIRFKNVRTGKVCRILEKREDAKGVEWIGVEYILTGYQCTFAARDFSKIFTRVYL